MKRVLLSIVCGVLIPFLYGVVIGSLSTHIQSYAISQALYFPIGWPRLLLQRIIPLDVFPFRDGDKFPLFLYMVFCNVVLYGSLSYFLFWEFSRRRKPQLEAPPDPPNFV